jgi:hypothetical protein
MRPMSPRTASPSPAAVPVSEVCLKSPPPKGEGPMSFPDAIITGSLIRKP